MKMEEIEIVRYFTFKKSLSGIEKFDKILS